MTRDHGPFPLKAVYDRRRIGSNRRMTCRRGMLLAILLYVTLDL